MHPVHRHRAAPRARPIPRLAAVLLVVVVAACSRREAGNDGDVVLHVESIPAGAAPLGRWAYTLHPPVAGRLEVALVDVRRPDEGVELVLDVEPDAPVEMAFFLPDRLEPWTQRPTLHCNWTLTQGTNTARLEGPLPAEMLPEAVASTVPGPTTALGGRPPAGDVSFAPGAPVVLAGWMYLVEPITGYDLWPVGVVGAPGDPFPGLTGRGDMSPDPAVVDGAFLELRLRFTPDARG